MIAKSADGTPSSSLKLTTLRMPLIQVAETERPYLKLLAAAMGIASGTVVGLIALGKSKEAPSAIKTVLRRPSLCRPLQPRHHWLTLQCSCSTAL